MGNSWFQFKQFMINQDKTAMKVGVDSVLLGASASFNNPKNILDIGAGTGLLSFMAEQRTNAKITAVEIEHNAFLQCKENILLNKKGKNIEVYNISIQKIANNYNKKFDHIICNPPYFENSFLSENNVKNIARHTNELSYNELILSVDKLLKQNGIFSVILPFEKHDNFVQLSIQIKLFCFRKIIIFPNKNKQANRIILEFSKFEKEFITEEIIIRDSETNQYTIQYKELTKDFYLKK